MSFKDFILYFFGLIFIYLFSRFLFWLIKINFNHKTIIEIEKNNILIKKILGIHLFEIFKGKPIILIFYVISLVIFLFNFITLFSGFIFQYEKFKRLFLFGQKIYADLTFILIIVNYIVDNKRKKHVKRK